MQGPPAAQPGHEPPQSTPVSVPFFCESVQDAAWHTLLVQIFVAQSVATVQPPPAAQG
jgi:hypothetical protein